MYPYTSARLLILSALLLPALAGATTYRVADHDVAGLIQAIEQANRSSQPSRIELAPHGLYWLKTSAQDGFGLPAIKSTVTFVGNAAEIRRYSDQHFALLRVERGAKLTLENLILAEGDRGAVVNNGELTLKHTHVVDNTAPRGTAIVENYGTLIAQDSQISFNAILNAQRDAGILINYGRLELRDTRMESNQVTGKYAALATAFAVLNFGDSDFRDVVIRNSSAEVERDGVASGRAVVNLGNGVVHESNLQLVDNWPNEGETPVPFVEQTR
jgi:hypothetical protein